MPLRGDRLKLAREQLGISQRELAARCEVGDTAIWKYEHAKIEPTTDTVVRLAKELGVSADWLLGLTHEMRGLHTPDANLSPDERTVLAAYRRGDITPIMTLIMERMKRDLAERGDIPGEQSSDSGVASGGGERVEERKPRRGGRKKRH
jgi:transcriptional regulator with XRE-family HTH domain